MSLKFNALASELENAAAFYGAYSAVARRLGVTPQHVRQVAKGNSTSKRVSAELARELRRRRAKIQRRAA